MDFTSIINQPNTKIIDVREPQEFAMRHVPGAVNIPLGSIPSRLEEFRNMEQPIVLYCASGNRSGQAAGFLRANGIEEAYNGGGLFEMEHYMAQVA
ncbi:MAG TPA: rhodanese-like domain-containing protein [Bacteroidetes bacterium]|nr:rhodanese-like domain-containing protein [Bacteroidota bacterium]